MDSDSTLLCSVQPGFSEFEGEASVPAHAFSPTRRTFSDRLKFRGFPPFSVPCNDATEHKLIDNGSID